MSLETVFVETPEVERGFADGHPTMPGLESLGWGYDVFDGEYASSKSTTYPLFDFADMMEKQVKSHTYMIPRDVNFQRLDTYTGKMVYGKTVQQHQTDLLQQTGVQGAYMGFKASLEVSFARSTFRRSMYEYTTYVDLIQLWQLRLADSTTLFATLKPDVEEDIESLPPEDLFEKYGTHYLGGIIVGARAAYSSATDTQEYKSEESLAIDAQASYQAFVSGTSNTDIKKRVEEFRNNSITTVIAKGGNPAYGRDILEQGNYDRWTASTEEWPAFVDFAYRGLRPISELSKDETRKTELEKAYDKYASAKGRPLGSTEIFPLRHGDRIALKADNDRYWGVTTKGSGSRIMPVHGEIAPDSEFTIKVLEKDRIALLASNGSYCGVTSGGLLAAVTSDPYEGLNSYRIKYFEDEGKIALQLYDSNDDGKVYLKRGRTTDGHELIVPRPVASPEHDRLCMFSVCILDPAE